MAVTSSASLGVNPDTQTLDYLDFLKSLSNTQPEEFEYSDNVGSTTTPKEESQIPRVQVENFHRAFNQIPKQNGVDTNIWQSIIPTLMQYDKINGSDEFGDIFAFDKQDIQGFSELFYLDNNQRNHLTYLVFEEQNATTMAFEQALDAFLRNDNSHEAIKYKEYLLQMLVNYDKNNAQKTIVVTNDIVSGDTRFINNNTILKDDKSGTLQDIDSIDINAFIEHTGMNPKYAKILEAFVNSQRSGSSQQGAQQQDAQAAQIQAAQAAQAAQIQAAQIQAAQIQAAQAAQIQAAQQQVTEGRLI